MTQELVSLLVVAASAISSAATATMAYLAWRQLRVLNAQQKADAEALASDKEREKRWKTVEACERLDLDPLYNDACDHIRDIVHRDQDYSQINFSERKTWSSVVTILNALDNLCLGIQQNVYVEEIVLDHHKVSIVGAYEAFLKSPNETINPDDFENMVLVYNRLKENPTRYKSPD